MVSEVQLMLWFSLLIVLLYQSRVCAVYRRNDKKNNFCYIVHYWCVNIVLLFRKTLVSSIVYAKLLCQLELSH